MLLYNITFFRFSLFTYMYIDIPFDSYKVFNLFFIAHIIPVAYSTKTFCYYLNYFTGIYYQNYYTFFFIHSIITGTYYQICYCFKVVKVELLKAHYKNLRQSHNFLQHWVTWRPNGLKPSPNMYNIVFSNPQDSILYHTHYCCHS